MSEFTDFNELVKPLVLPIGGKQYTIPPVSFDAGARVHGLIEDPANHNEEEFFRLLLGDEVFEQMRNDNAPSAAIDRAAKTALADFKYGRAVAEVMWETGGDPKAVQAMAPNPNRAARRSKGTGGASKTR